MRENQLPVHYTSAEETRRVRPAIDSGDCGVHIPRQRVTHVEASPAGNYLADDLSNSVPITVAKRGTWLLWLLASAVISVTTLYTICNPQWVPSSVAQTVKISKQLSADIKRRSSTPLGGTAVTDTTKAGAGTVAVAAGIHCVPTDRNSASAVQAKGKTAIYGVTRDSVVGDVCPAAPATLRDVDRSAAQHDGFSSGADQTLASDGDETGTRDFMNQGFNQGITFPTTEMPKAAEAKTSKSKKCFMVPPPPPTPCVLPPPFGFYPMQPAQQQAAPQQQLQQAQAQASPKSHNQAAAPENTPQQSDQELQAADQELQAALRSSLLTVDEWKR